MNDAIKKAILNIVKDEVIKIAVTKAPILGSRLLYPITSLIINKVLEIALNETELAIYIYKTKYDTAEEAKKVDQAQQQLDNAKTDEEKQNAENNLKDSLRDLIRIRP